MKINLKDFKKLDYIIVGVVALALLVSGLVFFAKTRIVKTPVEAERKVVFQVFFRGITLTSETPPFKAGEETFITIRNVPHKKILILETFSSQKKIILPLLKDGKPIIVDDVSNPFMFDFIVNVVDDAKITDDGPVMGGNKLKIGLPIILEGKDYRFNGVVSGLKILNEQEQKTLEEQLKQENAK